MALYTVKIVKCAMFSLTLFAIASVVADDQIIFRFQAR